MKGECNYSPDLLKSINAETIITIIGWTSRRIRFQNLLNNMNVERNYTLDLLKNTNAESNYRLDLLKNIKGGAIIGGLQTLQSKHIQTHHTAPPPARQSDADRPASQ